MNTVQFPSDTSERSLLGQLAMNMCSVFSRLDSASSALAASLASELQEQPEVRELVLALEHAPRRARVASLLQMAGELRRDSHTYAAADALKRMASRPMLFTAVARELHEEAELCTL